MSNGALINLDTDGTIVITPATGKVLHLRYDALDPSYWATSSPTEIYEAIDRIAAVVSSNGAVPIP